MSNSVTTLEVGTPWIEELAYWLYIGVPPMLYPDTKPCIIGGVQDNWRCAQHKPTSDREGSQIVFPSPLPRRGPACRERESTALSGQNLETKHSCLYVARCCFRVNILLVRVPLSLTYYVTTEMKHPSCRIQWIVDDRFIWTIWSSLPLRLTTRNKSPAFVASSPSETRVALMLKIPEKDETSFPLEFQIYVLAVSSLNKP